MSICFTRLTVAVGEGGIENNVTETVFVTDLIKLLLKFF